MSNKNITVMQCVFCLCLFCVFISCGGDLEEPLLADLINLQIGSPGYEGDGMVQGLRNGSYIIRHTKDIVYQEKNPAGEIIFLNKEDWYAVDALNSAFWVSSSISGIPAIVGTVPLDAEPSGYDTNINPVHLGLNTISGLVNGEMYTLYAYAELSDGDWVGRLPSSNVALPTRSYNAFLNLKNMGIDDEIYLADQNEDTTNRTGCFSNINHFIVLVNTPLYWTEFPQTISERTGAFMLVEGRDFDIEIKMQFQRGDWITVDAIQKEGQQYFVLTGSPIFRGWLTLKSK